MAVAKKPQKKVKSPLKIMESVGEPAKMTPKLAANVAIFKLSNGQVVLRFFSNVGQEQNTLIETIVVDDNHALKIVEALSGVFKKKK